MRPRQSPPPSPPPIETGQPRLLVVDGPGAGCRWTLSQPLVLGRADLNPDDVRLSRRHIQVELREDGCWLHDLSVNGTWVSRAAGRRDRVAGTVSLSPGDLIVVGESVLQYQV